MIKLGGVSEQTEQGLKPCPFCGGKASLNDNSSCSYVHCEKCGATGESFNMSKKYRSDEKAAEAWNRRADNEQM